LFPLAAIKGVIVAREAMGALFVEEWGINRDALVAYGVGPILVEGAAVGAGFCADYDPIY